MNLTYVSRVPEMLTTVGVLADSKSLNFFGPVGLVSPETRWPSEAKPELWAGFAATLD
jgi:hypothetical protein